MPFISASAITPYNSIRGGAAGEAIDPILAYSPFNVWDSEHVTIDENATTLLDYNNVGTALDLVNPAASNQPSYNASSSDFNSLPSFTFNGSSDYVEKTISGYRESDSTGIFISVFRNLSDVNNLTMQISDSSQTIRYFNRITYNSSTFRTINLTNALAGFSSYRGSTNVENTTPKLLVHGSTGSEYKMWVGDTSQTITMLSGVNDGSIWLDDYASYDKISIGSLIRNSGIDYSNIEWCFSGYFPYVDDATTLEIIAILKTKYGI